MCNGPNHLNNFERGPIKDHSCEVWSKSNQWFKRGCRLKKFTDARTDARTTNNGQNVSRKAHLDIVTGELKILCSYPHLSGVVKKYRIRPNYCTVRLGFSKLLGTLRCDKIRGMFEMNCLFLSGDFKFQVSPKVLISCPRSTPRG